MLSGKMYTFVRNDKSGLTEEARARVISIVLSACPVKVHDRLATIPRSNVRASRSDKPSQIHARNPIGAQS